MIGEAIQSAVAAIIPNTFQSVGDEGIKTPFCVHEETDEPIYLKEGISGYNWTCEIAIIHSTPDGAEALAVRVISAVQALAGTTASETYFVSVLFEGSDPGFDQATREYMRLLRFSIETTNR